MSMARWLDDLGSDACVLFVHSARSPADLIFRDEIALLARRPGFRSIAVCEGDALGGERWGGFQGRLSPAMLALIAPDLLDRETFCCGSALYMASVRDMLGAAGYSMARYHEESFEFAAGQPVDEEPAPAERPYAVQFVSSGRSIACPPGTTILAAARSAGLRLPFACTKGVCGTCKSRLVSGAVDMRHGGGIRQREVDAGMILLCCSKPTTDLVVER
jgi:glycine betaine catabolism B